MQEPFSVVVVAASHSYPCHFTKIEVGPCAGQTQASVHGCMGRAGPYLWRCPRRQLLYELATLVGVNRWRKIYLVHPYTALETTDRYEYVRVIKCLFNE